MTGRFVFFLVFVDVPILTTAVVIGHEHPLRTIEAVNDWRMDHPWSMLPTLALCLWLCWRTYMRSSPG